MYLLRERQREAQTERHTEGDRDRKRAREKERDSNRESVCVTTWFVISSLRQHGTVWSATRTW